MNKILKENVFLKENVTLLKNLPIFKKYEEDLKRLRKLNTLLVKQLKKMRAKIEEYENYANLNLEIKEITRDPSQILQLDDNNWQQFILQNDMDAMGLNESDDGEDDGEEEEEEEDDEEDNEEDEKDDNGEENQEEPLSIENDIALEDNEISDDEEELKEWIWGETGDKYFIFTDGESNNEKIFENIDGKIGKEIGRLEEGIPFFS